MGVEFRPLLCRPVLSARNATDSRYERGGDADDVVSHGRKCPSGWWILPAIVLGCVEWVAIIGWIVA